MTNALTDNSNTYAVIPKSHIYGGMKSLLNSFMKSIFVFLPSLRHRYVIPTIEIHVIVILIIVVN